MVVWDSLQSHCTFLLDKRHLALCDQYKMYSRECNLKIKWPLEICEYCYEICKTNKQKNQQCNTYWHGHRKEAVLKCCKMVIFAKLFFISLKQFVPVGGLYSSIERPSGKRGHVQLHTRTRTPYLTHISCFVKCLFLQSLMAFNNAL